MRHSIAILASMFIAACGGGHKLEVAAPPSETASLAVDGVTSAGVESYQHRVDNPEMLVADAPLSTFSIDVDTASYSNVRRFLEDGQRPPADAVRIEELINYFDYGYADPGADSPVAVVAEVGPSPFHPGRRLLHVGIQGRRPSGPRPPLNLVFLLDTSGSMSDANKLPLVQQAMGLLAAKIGPRDRVGIVVYAGGAGIVLEPTSDAAAIRAALDRLGAGGSTNGSAGIEAAYALAERNLDPSAVNRVVLCTDGDFNVGVSDPEALVDLIETKRATGVYLTVLGFGTGNLKDSTMEALAQYGNGNYAYVDSLDEARKVLVDEMDGTLVTIARDVKVQVEFDPSAVTSYRLLGYENRLLSDKDFDDDHKDAGELGAGHSVTALYEIVPAGADAADVATVRLRYKLPRADQAHELAVPAHGSTADLAGTSADFRFAAAAAGFGMLLRDSSARGDATWSSIRALAAGATARDARRADLLRLIDRAAALQPATRAASR